MNINSAQKKTAPKHIALVGCGFSGTSAFFQLVDKYPVEEITIFEKSGDFGPGFPYQREECKDYLLNNTTDSLCITPQNKQAFLLWLKTKYKKKEQYIDPRGHLPRALFGEFLQDTFSATLTNAAVKGIKVNLIEREVLSIREENSKVSIHFYSNSIIADTAILTTGRLPELNNYEIPLKNSRSVFISSHVNTHRFDDIPSDSTVHVLGSSLSAFDVVNRLFSQNSEGHFKRDENGELCFESTTNNRKVVLWSRSGRLKALQSAKSKPIHRQFFTPDGIAALSDETTLTDIVKAIENDAKLNDTELSIADIENPFAGCQSVREVNTRAAEWLKKEIAGAKSSGSSNFIVELLADAQMDIWDTWSASTLPSETKRRYRENYESAFLSYFAPCPIETAEKLLALHKAGRLIVRKGVQSVQFDHGKDCYVINHEFGQDEASVLINTTGSVDKNIYSDNQSPLTKSLVQQQLLKAYSTGIENKYMGADVDMHTFKAVGSQNIYIANMMLWGPGFFTSSAFMMATIIDRLLSSIFEPQ